MQWVESAVGCGSSCLAMMALGMRCVGMRRLPMVASSFQRIRTAPVSMGEKCTPILPSILNSQQVTIFCPVFVPMDFLKSRLSN